MNEYSYRGYKEQATWGKLSDFQEGNLLTTRVSTIERTAQFPLSKTNAQAS